MKGAHYACQHSFRIGQVNSCYNLSIIGDIALTITNEAVWDLCQKSFLLMPTCITPTWIMPTCIMPSRIMPSLLPHRCYTRVWTPSLKKTCSCYCQAQPRRRSELRKSGALGWNSARLLPLGSVVLWASGCKVALSVATDWVNIFIVPLHIGILIGLKFHSFWNTCMHAHT